MIQSDNYRDYMPEGHDASSHNDPMHDDQGHYWDEKANMSRNIEKNIEIHARNVEAHERRNLNANQEQRPDSSNPERNRDK